MLPWLPGPGLLSPYRVITGLWQVSITPALQTLQLVLPLQRTGLISEVTWAVGTGSVTVQNPPSPAHPRPKREPLVLLAPRPYLQSGLALGWQPSGNVA